MSETEGFSVRKQTRKFGMNAILEMQDGSLPTTLTHTRTHTHTTRFSSLPYTTVWGLILATTLLLLV